MLNQTDIQLLCQRAIELSPAPATEVRITAGRSALTRVANGEIAQSIDRDRLSLSVRVLLGPADAPTKVGVASGNRVDDEGLKATIARAVAAAELQHDDPSLLPPPGPQQYPRSAAPFDPATVDCPAALRAEMLVPALDRCRRHGLGCAGAFATGGQISAIANSAGLFACDRRSTAELSLTVTEGDASGWCEQRSGRFEQINAKDVCRKATEIAQRSGRPAVLEPGRYSVVLPSDAVGDLLRFLVASLATKAIIEGRSFFSDKLGQRVFGENVTLLDDAFLPATGGAPFDAEGLPRQRVKIVQDGVFSRMLHGRQTARAASSEPTGHGLPAPSAEGALPGNLVLAPGQATIDELIGQVDRGLLVTHFHYTNMLRPTELAVTGMTRDGLFLIENGQVAGPVCNMRFTQSLAEALRQVREFGRDLSPVPGMGGDWFAAPPALIDGFNFSSATKF